jgi:hypothetical protein
LIFFITFSFLLSRTSAFLKSGLSSVPSATYFTRPCEAHPRNHSESASGPAMVGMDYSDAPEAASGEDGSNDGAGLHMDSGAASAIGSLGVSCFHGCFLVFFRAKRQSV